LQARELDVQAFAPAISRQAFSQAGHAFEQDVAVGEQADDQPFRQILLADDDLAEFVKQRCVNAPASFTLR